MSEGPHTTGGAGFPCTESAPSPPPAAELPHDNAPASQTPALGRVRLPRGRRRGPAVPSTGAARRALAIPSVLPGSAYARHTGRILPMGSPSGPRSTANMHFSRPAAGIRGVATDSWWTPARCDHRCLRWSRASLLQQFGDPVRRRAPIFRAFAEHRAFWALARPLAASFRRALFTPGATSSRTSTPLAATVAPRQNVECPQNPTRKPGVSDCTRIAGVR